MIATSYPFLEVFWTILIFFAFFIWIWLLFIVFADIFRNHESSGWVKVAWIVFIIIVPYLGVFVYLIAEHQGMTERSIKQQEAAKSEMDQYVRSVAGSDPSHERTPDAPAAAAIAQAAHIGIDCTAGPPVAAIEPDLIQDQD